MNPGDLYFVDDKFFDKVNDPCLKINYETTKRPHVVALKDSETGLYWVVPCSSKIEKFEKILDSKRQNNKDTQGIYIAHIAELRRKAALLFQDMFPVTEKYLIPYEKDDVCLSISSISIVKNIKKRAHYCCNFVKTGRYFSKTPPDVNRIEKIMLRELDRIDR